MKRLPVTMMVSMSLFFACGAGMDDSGALSTSADPLFHGKEVVEAAPELSAEQRAQVRTDVRSHDPLMPWAGRVEVEAVEAPALSASQRDIVRKDVRSTDYVMPWLGMSDVKVQIESVFTQNQLRNLRENAMGNRPPVFLWSGMPPYRAFACPAQASAAECIAGFKPQALPKAPDRCSFVNSPDNGFVGFVCPDAP